MGEFKGFMKYNKQSLSELSLVDRLSNHDAFQQRFLRMMPPFKVHVAWIVVHHFVKPVYLMEEKQSVVLSVTISRNGMI